ncbi:UDP-glucose 6-dehydrogenase [Thiomicrorhabdus immobilis]|uniref:UDP-glucose 6-dehydrogenase n=1 Tax=Thiomicrorhabdus immobilis TaxID=2791037 RepID=A0ABN6CUS7_9GAMM|nr:nucleotide sugar dehydrogenase [Thiomicrorhabdus immobilis]BCN92721.1 UDP-glucose 6-dehydrogenase [Thiomicrorhabdus immobilis]
MKINVFGNTISAMVCAGCLAETGNNVTLIGKRPDDIAEPGLVALLDNQLTSGRLTITDKLNPQAECHIIALEPDDCHNAKLIANQLAQSASPESTLIVRSNFTIGLAKELAQTAKLEFAVNPDFAADGHAIQRFTRPDRIIIGTSSEKIREQLKQIFAPFNRNRDVILNMTPASAELTKYATNAMLATRISLMNELATISEVIDADIEEVRLGLGADKRIGRAYLYPGIGFGGDNFTRDLERIKSLLPQAHHHGGKSLLQSVIDINENQKELFFRKLWQHFDCDLKGKTITLWGLGYKPHTTSIESSASLTLITAFINQGCSLKLHDPFALEASKEWVHKNLSNHQQQQISFHSEMYDATENSDALCVLTEYKAFWSPDLAVLKENMQTPIILDGRNLYNKFWVEDNEFIYYGVGR